MLSRMNPNADQDWKDPVLQVLGVQLKLCVNSSRTEMPIDFFPFCVIKDKFPAQVDEKLGCFCPFPPQVYFDVCFMQNSSLSFE